VSKGAKSSHNILEVFNESKNSKVKGTVVLMKKNVLDFNDFHASFLDRLHEFLGQKVSLQLISAVNGDPGEFIFFFFFFFLGNKFVLILLISTISPWK